MESPKPVATETAAPAPAPAAAPKTATTYQDAVDWYGRTRGFHFTMKSSEFDVEGDMARPRPGQERVRFTSKGEEWLGASQRTGVVWYRRDGDAWQKAPPPPFADGIYQRATIFVDPQKSEGEAQPAGDRGWSFTDANSGARHTVRADAAGRVVAIEIEAPRRLTMALTKLDELVNIEPPGE